MIKRSLYCFFVVQIIALYRMHNPMTLKRDVNFVDYSGNHSVNAHNKLIEFKADGGNNVSKDVRGRGQLSLIVKVA